MKARELTGVSGLESGNLPGKLADCQNVILEIRIVIVEGDSAGGSYKLDVMKDTSYLTFAWKSVGVEKARRSNFKNRESTTLISAIGAGIEFDPTKARYHKIILMADADVDGAHITCLLLTFFIVICGSY